MISNYLDTIEAISQRLDNKVSPSLILKWLKNFDEKDWGKALTVLSRIEYFSNEEIIRAFDSYLKEIISDFEFDTKSKIITNIINFFGLGRIRLFESIITNKQIILHPVGEFLKSGTSMFYPLKQTPAFKSNSVYLQVVDDYNDLEKKMTKDSFLVLVDDISGSGETVAKYYKNKIRPILAKPKFNNVKVVLLTIVFLDTAKDKLAEYGIQIYGNNRASAFVQTGSVFGYRPRMKEIREFCYKNGKGLYTTFDHDNNKIIDHPLGHNNSQALIIFEHSTPNNTLPIFWSNRNNWFPIFPRFGNDKIELAYNLKFDTYKWISQLEKLGFKSLFQDDQNKYQKINLQLLMILRLKKMGKNNKSICQFLEINNVDFKNIINKGISRNLFANDGSITNYGNDLYFQLKKKQLFMKGEKIEFSLNETYPENIFYLPATFRGMT